MAVCMEGRPPSSIGHPSLSPAMRKCVPKHFSVDLALSCNAGGIGLSHVAIQIWILVGCSSRLMERVALDANSMAAGIY